MGVEVRGDWLPPLCGAELRSWYDIVKLVSAEFTG